MGQVDDIADVVTFLAGSASRWITGEIIGVTGGQAAGATILRTLGTAA
jgi:NAD(P)-dependent dehydrogenase (short-subunit alcohol dehydrogenase family)